MTKDTPIARRRTVNQSLQEERYAHQLRGNDMEQLKDSNKKSHVE